MIGQEGTPNLQPCHTKQERPSDGLACEVEGPPGPPHNGHAALVKVAVLASLQVVRRVTAAVSSEHRLGVIALGALHIRSNRKLIPALCQCRGAQAWAAACDVHKKAGPLMRVQACPSAHSGLEWLPRSTYGGLCCGPEGPWWAHSKALVGPVAAAAARQVQGTVRAGSGRVAAFVGAPPARTALRPAQGKLEGMMPPGSASLPAHRKVVQVACMQIQAIFYTSLATFKGKAHRAHSSHFALKARKWWCMYTYVTHQWPRKMLPPGKLNKLSQLNISSVVSNLTPAPTATNVTRDPTSWQ